MKYLSFAQMTVSLLLILLILLQERSSGLSGVFGGGEHSYYRTRRGIERAMFIGTIVLAGVFAGLSLLSLAS